MKNKFNKKTFEEIVNGSKRVSLSDNKRSSIKDNVLYFMKNAPVRKLDMARPTWRETLLINIKLRYMPIVLVVSLLLGSGGVAYAAESSLPGDLMYPVKTGINEKVVVALSFSNEEKAKTVAKFAERRLEEMEVLVAEGRLEPEQRAEIEAHFKKQSDNFAKRVAVIQETDLEAAIEVSAEFEATVKAHSQLISKLLAMRADLEARGELLAASATEATEVNVSASGEVAQSEEGRLLSMRAELEARGGLSSAPAIGASESQIQASYNDEIKSKTEITARQSDLPLYSNAEIRSNSDFNFQISYPVLVESQLEAWANNSAAIESSGSVEAQAGLAIGGNKKLESVIQKIGDLKAFLQKKKDSLRASVYVEAEARISVAESLVVEARAQIEAKEQVKAFSTLVSAESVLIQTRILINIGDRIDVELDFNGTSESAVSPDSPNSNDQIRAGARVDGSAKVYLPEGRAMVTLPSYQGLRDQIYENRVKIDPPNIDVRSRLQPINIQSPSVEFRSELQPAQQPPMIDIQSELKLLNKSEGSNLRTFSSADFNFDNGYIGGGLNAQVDTSSQINF